MDLNDHMIGDDDLCLENLVFNHSMEKDDFLMKNHLHDDPFDFVLREIFEENRYIF